MTVPSWPARLWPLWWLLPTFMVVFPLLRLLPLDGDFYIDWHNHKWLAAYSGEYLRQHGTVPVVVNTTEQAGMPFPIFYGTLFYPVISLLTVSLDPGVAIRLVALLITGLQFRLITCALARVDVPTGISRGIACLVIWAIYPLTNLYNRSAITEYVATALLTCTVASWFLLIHAEQPSDRRRIGAGFGLLFALAAGSHPITALYSLPILVLLFVAAYHEHGRAPRFWRALAKALALPVVLVLVVLAPWIYALHCFNKFLMIHAISGPTVWFDTAELDHWSTRLFPMPYDGRTNNTPLSGVSTPYLDAQINMPLLVLVFGWLAICAWRNRALGLAGLRALAVPLVALMFFAWISLSPSAYDWLPSFARLLQIAYRAVTYQNLALLLSGFMLAGFLRRRRAGAPLEDRPALAGLLIGCLVISGSGVVVKWMHATAIMQRHEPSKLRAPASERRRWIALPSQFYGARDYATPGLYPGLTAAERTVMGEARFPIGTGASFGVPQPVRLSLPSDTWVVTDVQAFPWNRLEVDGTAVSDDQLRAESSWFVVRVPAGKHTLTLRTAADTVWLVLTRISFAVLALWFAWVSYLVVAGWARRRFPIDRSVE